jgi:hypothetical protein
MTTTRGFSWGFDSDLPTCIYLYRYVLLYFNLSFTVVCLNTTVFESTDLLKTEWEEGVNWNQIQQVTK